MTPELLRSDTNLTRGIFISSKECMQENKSVVSYESTELVTELNVAMTKNNLGDGQIRSHTPCDQRSEGDVN